MSAREKAVLREKERQEEQLDTAIAELQKLTKGNKAGASFSTRTSNLNLPVEGGRVKRYRDNMAEITGPKGARITAIYEGKVVDVKRNRITNRIRCLHRPRPVHHLLRQPQFGERRQGADSGQKQRDRRHRPRGRHPDHEDRIQARIRHLSARRSQEDARLGLFPQITP